MEDRLIHVETASWIEGMNEHLVVGFPRIKGRWKSLGDKAISFNTATARIITGDNDLSCQKKVTEPHLVFWQEPVGIVCNVKLSKCATRVRRSQSNPGNVFLNMPLPGQVRFAVARKELARRGHRNQVDGAKKGQDQINQFGRKARETAPCWRRVRRNEV